jgi:hypothetical protein
VPLLGVDDDDELAVPVPGSDDRAPKADPAGGTLDPVGFMSGDAQPDRANVEAITAIETTYAALTPSPLSGLPVMRIRGPFPPALPPVLRVEGALHRIGTRCCMLHPCP